MCSLSEISDLRRLPYAGSSIPSRTSYDVSPITPDKKASPPAEELLREQLLELGEDPASLAPHLIMQNMQCEVYPDESMVYIWKDIPILRVAPERTDTGVMWRMFTRDEGEPLQ